MIGIDLDNTIICYDRLIRDLAITEGLITKNVPPDKKATCEAIRTGPNGELAWQELQARIYGFEISKAQPFPGVMDFFRKCQKASLPVCIISHKTSVSNFDDTTDLRSPAMKWLEEKGFWGTPISLIPAERVQFHSTRREKIQAIAATGCTHFIDDLEEILTDRNFPTGVQKILFSPKRNTAPSGIALAKSWPECWNLVTHLVNRS